MGTLVGATADGAAQLTMPDGKAVSLPILVPTYGKDRFLDVASLHKSTGCFTYDPGLSVTATCESGITFIDGDEGVCCYRGYPVDQLAQKTDFLTTAYLLLHGDLPTPEQDAEWRKDVHKYMVVNTRLIEFYRSFPDGAHPMAQMNSVVGAMSAFYPVSLDPNDKEQHIQAAVRLIAKMNMISALIYRTDRNKSVIYPRKDLTYAENFMYMTFGDCTDVPGTVAEDMETFRLVAKAIDAFLILHADHEQNASTSTVRIAGSSQANPYACIASGIASLWGPAHGGANEAVIQMLEKIGKPENVPQFIEDVKNKKAGVRLMGFGHRVYKNFDPRAKYFGELVVQVLDKLGVNDPHLEVARELQRVALSDEYFVQRKLYPNVDFYTGIMLRAMHIPTNMFTVMFALARTVGWVSQYTEMVEQPGMRITRPRQIYIGTPLRSVP